MKKKHTVLFVLVVLILTSLQLKKEGTFSIPSDQATEYLSLFGTMLQPQTTVTSSLCYGGEGLCLPCDQTIYEPSNTVDTLYTGGYSLNCKFDLPTNPAFITYEFSSLKEVNTVLLVEYVNQCHQNLHVQLSTDCTTFHDVGTAVDCDWGSDKGVFGTNAGGASKNSRLFSFPTEQAKCVRLYVPPGEWNTVTSIYLWETYIFNSDTVLIDPTTIGITLGAVQWGTEQDILDRVGSTTTSANVIDMDVSLPDQYVSALKLYFFDGRSPETINVTVGGVTHTYLNTQLKSSFVLPINSQTSSINLVLDKGAAAQTVILTDMELLSGTPTSQLHQSATGYVSGASTFQDFITEANTWVTS